MRQIFKSGLFACLCMFILASCSEKGEFVPEVGLKMEFETVPLAVENNINYLWHSVVGADSYTLQIATDKNFTNIVLEEASINAICYTATGLMYDTEYYSRIRANFPTGSSAWAVADNGNPVICSRTIQPILNSCKISDINGYEATLGWVMCNGIDSVVVIDSVSGTTLISRALTPAEISSRSVTLNVPRRPSCTPRAFLKYGSGESIEPALRGKPLNQIPVLTYYPTPISITAFAGVTPQINFIDKFKPQLTAIDIYSLEDMTLIASHMLTAADTTGKKFYRFATNLPTNKSYLAVCFNTNAPTQPHPSSQADPGLFDFRRYNIVEFKTFVPGPTKVEAPAEFMPALADSYDGVTLDLKGSTTFSATEFTLDKNLTIKGRDTELAKLAVINFQKQWTISGVITQPIVFQNLKFIRDANTAGSNMNTVVFTTPASGTAAAVSKLYFKNCVFENMDYGIINLVNNNAGIVFDTIMFENCMFTFTYPDVFNVRTAAQGGPVNPGYNSKGIVMGNGSGPTMKNYIFRNCTISKLKYPIGYLQNMNKAVAVELTNNTIYNLNYIPDYLFRIGASSTLFFKNNLFAFNQYNRYFRPFIAGNIQVGNSGRTESNIYTTNDTNLGVEKGLADTDSGASDYSSSVVDTPGKVYNNAVYGTSGALNGMLISADIRPDGNRNNGTIGYRLTENPNVLPVSSKELFLDPDNNKFYFKITSYGNLGIGDSRWWNEGTLPMP